jgi:hypothetical protein
MRRIERMPGVARRQVTFLVLPRKVTKRNRPRFAALRLIFGIAQGKLEVRKDRSERKNRDAAHYLYQIFTET